MVNRGGRQVFIERNGELQVVADRTLELRNLTVAIKNIARACGDEISEAQPALDARLDDGSRIAAMFPPCSVDGPTLTVRKFGRHYTMDELVQVGTLTRALATNGSAAITPTNIAPVQISTQGELGSPRGCQGTFGSVPVRAGSSQCESVANRIIGPMHSLTSATIG